MEVTKCNRHTGKHSASEDSSVRVRRLEDLPADLIVDILSRLSVKSLMCCRCVCKIWLNIVDSPFFTNMHFTRCSADAPEEPQLMEVCHVIESHHKMRFFTVVDAGTEVLRSSEFPIVEISISYGYSANSLCYGLFYLRTSLSIKSSKRGSSDAVTPDEDFYGMGFDCTTETCKLIRIFSRKSNYDLQQNDLATEVYTLGTRSWREIPSVPPCYVSGRTVSAFGDMHWLGRRWFHDGSDEVMIMSFDTRRDEFKLTPHP